jgi:GNAT superfamily N-acetyltransferase
MTRVTIRPAVPADHASIETIQRRASLAIPEYREQLLAFPDALGVDAAEIATGRVVVAAGDSGLAGYANWVEGGASGEAELDGLFVDPLLWRGGIGRALVDAIAEDARAAGKDRLRVIANPTAIAFYERCAFAVTGEAGTRFGKAPVMTRGL